MPFEESPKASGSMNTALALGRCTVNNGVGLVEASLPVPPSELINEVWASIAQVELMAGD